MNVYIDKFRDLSRRTQAATLALVLTFAGIAPVLISGTAAAAPTITQRQLASTSARPSITTDLTWTFNTTADTANVDHIEIEFCDQPLTGCATNVTGATDNGNGVGTSDKIPLLPASPTATLSGPWTSTGNAATRVAGDTGGVSNQILIDKTTADDATSKTGLTISVAGFTNDTEANASYYTRMRLYSDTGTTLVWEGIFAQSTSQTLTVNARVQERLDFCVGSTTVDDATTTPGAACTNITGTTVDIGNIENGQVNVSPVDPSNGGNNTNGVAMVRTNAVNGVVVDYKSIQASGTNSLGALRVSGATCSAETAVSTTDQCFNSSDTGSDPSDGATAAAITPGTEKFGMTIAGINCGSSTAYGCTFTTGVYNLVRDAEYDGNGGNTYSTEFNQVGSATANSYAWLSNGVADRIASSASSTVKVVDDEALILKFAATAGVTTPTGAYSVQSDFIATTTF